MAVPLMCLLLTSLFVNAATMEFDELGGTGTKQAEPLTRHKMIQCFDENVNIRDPKNFEIEKRKKNEETKMSIIRHKRHAGCIVKTRLINDDDEPENFRSKTSFEVPPVVHTYNSHTVTSPPVHHNYENRHSHHVTLPPVHRNYHYVHSVTSPPVHKTYHRSHTVTSPPVVHTYRHSHSVTSPPVVHTYNRHHSQSSSHDDQGDDNIVNDLSMIPHLPTIPHIGHVGTYPRSNVNPYDITGNGDLDETVEPDPGEKTITFKTNTRRHETVDQTGFVKEKTNGYPHRLDDNWRNKFKGILNMMDENDRVVNSSASFCIVFSYEHVAFAVLLHWGLRLLA